MSGMLWSFFCVYSLTAAGSWDSEYAEFMGLEYCGLQVVYMSPIFFFGI